jgi:hypothetical protein
MWAGRGGALPTLLWRWQAQGLHMSYVMLEGLSMQNGAIATMIKYWREAAAPTSAVRHTPLV